MKYLDETNLGSKEINKINSTIDNVPFYNNNSRIVLKEDIKKIKVYSKDDIRDNWDKCISRNINLSDLVVDYTSGSTGKPFKIGRTRKDINVSQKYVWKFRNAFLPNAIVEKHVEFGRNMRYFLQNPGEIILQKGNTLFVKGILSIDMIGECVTVLNEYQPKWILGPASFLVQFVEMAQKGYKLDIHPQFIENAGEYLYPNAKKYLEDYFRCPVVNHYGARELWPLAFECKCGKMHVLEENAYIEVLNKNEEGFGELLLSSLQVEAMPLLRYRIGDIGRIFESDCSCGAKSKIIELIGARINDYAESRDGKRVGAFFFSTIFVDCILRRGYKGILNWKIVQCDYDKFDIHIVRGKEYSEEIEDILKKYICEEFTNAEINFVYEDKIELGINGKMQYFVNNVHD